MRGAQVLHMSGVQVLYGVRDIRDIQDIRGVQAALTALISELI